MSLDDSAATIRVGCPNCGKKLVAPSALEGKCGRCPGCQTTFLLTTEAPPVAAAWGAAMPTPAPAPTATHSAPLPTFETGGPPVASPFRFFEQRTDWTDHAVADPDRAESPCWVPDALTAPSSFLAEALLAIVGGVIGIVVGVVLILIDQSMKGDALPFNIAGGLLILGSLVGAAWQVVVATVWATTAFAQALFARRGRRTPDATLRTFLSAVPWRLYSRAYNCLTDSARVASKVAAPDGGWIKNLAPAPQFASFAGFAAYWYKISASYEADFRSLRSTRLDELTVRLEVPVTFSWQDAQGDKTRSRRQTICALFIAVRRGDFWFLANGFFWPLTSKATTET